MAIASYTLADIEDALDVAGINDIIDTTASGQIGDAIPTFFDAIDAALVAFGEDPRTDLETTRVTFSTGGKAALVQLAAATPTEWADDAVWRRESDALIEEALAAVPVVSAGDQAYATTPDPAAADLAAVAANIYARAHAQATVKIKALRLAVKDALEALDPALVPAMSDSVTYTTSADSLLGVIAGATPLVGWPVAIATSRVSALTATFEESIDTDTAVTDDEYVP